MPDPQKDLLAQLYQNGQKDVPDDLHVDPSLAELLLQRIYSEPSRDQRMALPKQNVIDLGDLAPGGQMNVPDPPQFQPYPQTNNPEVARRLFEMIRRYPPLQGMVGKVTVGPTEDAITDIQQSNEEVKRRLSGTIFTNPALDFPNTNLNGLTNTRTNNVTLNPRLADPREVHDNIRPSLFNTLAHELTHVAGWEDPEAYGVGELINQLRGNLPPLPKRGK